MKKINFIILLFSLTNLSISQASDSVGDCLGMENNTDLANADLPISGLVIDKKSEFVFCYQLSSDPAKKEMNEEFKLLDVMGVFDSNGCVIEAKRNEATDGLLKKFIAKNVGDNVNIYASVDPVTKRANVIYSNSADKKYIDTALTTKDKWQIGGLAVGSIAIGAIMTENLYKGQDDKKKHWRGGAMISGATTGIAYLVLETAGLGDKLGLSKNQKKALIMLSGPIMGTIAGIFKEYRDTKDRAHHTVDVNDAIATSLGAGGAIFSIAFAL